MTNGRLVIQRPEPDPRGRLDDILAEAHHADEHRLPTERRLTQLLGIKRGPLRRLLSELEAEGKIWRHVGRGTFAGERPVHADVDLKIVCEHSSPTEVLEARTAIEPQLAALAAVRASAKEIAELSQLAKKCASAPNFDVYEKLDKRFHGGIARASGNRALIALFNGLNAVRREVVWKRLRQRYPKLERQQQTLFTEQHFKIVQEMDRHDSEGARKAMRSHLTSFDSLYLSIGQ
jgi:GntR family transcriptional regulator, transcriptional repressor for pyruvate dehydrogenase complex